MVVLTEINSTETNLYLINQIFDILLWSWILLIMIKRVICKKLVTRNYHFYSDMFLLLASIVAVTQFSDQFYIIATHIKVLSYTTRTIIWMIFHKLLTMSILIKYKNSQPKLFYNIRQEIKHLFGLKTIEL